MYLLGCDIGCSSVKVSIVDAETGLPVGTDFYPKEEAPIIAHRPGWAEQNPEDWWLYVKEAIQGALEKSGINGEDIKAIGIAYQMHGLVVVDKNKDYIAMRMTGEIRTTIPGLSEGIVWDFQDHCLSEDLLRYFGISKDLIADLVPTFGLQGELLGSVATELGLKKGTPVTYRMGDQSNNALSLNVLRPGEVAATARTSGVVYGVNSKLNYDVRSRVNTFAHVNHTAEHPRLGVLLCINGVGILNAWVKKTIARNGITYDQLNDLAASVPIGSEGLSILPFGNGAERMLENKQVDCSIFGLNFNIHHAAHIARAAQEGIVFAFKYGMDIMNEMGIDIEVIRAAHSSMFLSPILREALAGVTGTYIELYDTNGAIGAAKGAGIGAGIYASFEEAFSSLKKIAEIEPDGLKADKYCGAYEIWKERLEKIL